MISLGTILGKHRGIGPGFDFLRVFLAVSIVAVHSVVLTGHKELYEQSWTWYLSESLVPCFFALSGFLVTASAMRLSLKNFLINRGLRIIPALAVDVVVCALIIGPIFTTWALHDYFTDRRFITYFGNVVGRIHYFLPGVFEDHPIKNVNGALWTVPYEIMCYAIASFFIVAKWLPSKYKVSVFTFAVIAVSALLAATPLPTYLPASISGRLEYLLLGHDAQIVQAFLLGVVIYQWRERVPYSKWIFFGCVGICITAALLPVIAKSPASRVILLPALAYITVFVGLTEVPIPSYFKKGDYSYGIYLYHDPFLQVIIALFPAIALANLWGTLFTYVCGLAMVMVAANLSWHFVEKPILALRKKFSFVARVRDLGDQAKPTDTSAADLKGRSAGIASSTTN